VPSSHFKYAKNPEYLAAREINFDGVEVPIVSDNATRLAQFRAGNIHTDVLTASPEDIVATKKDVDELLFLQSGSFSPSTSPITTFGWDPSAVWHDERNRQGISMLIDREAYVDVIYNRDRFAGDGIDVELRMNSMVPGGWGTDLWADPTDASAFGEEGKYLQLNVEEAKKLFSAAGLPDGFEFDFYFNGGAQFGPAYARGQELYAGFFADGGLSPKPVAVTPFDVWLSHYSRRYSVAFEIYNQNPHHSGVTFVAERTYSTLPVQIRNQMHPAGQGYRGMVPPGGSLEEGDPTSNDLTVKINQEFDTARQADLILELARYAASKSYYITKPAAERAFFLYWPAIGNVGLQVGYPNANNWADLRTMWWLDTTKAPFA
jgi:ABC-type transport system substrate-binding protein